MVSIKLSPLRERMEDIPDLVTHFLGKYAPTNNYRVEQSFVNRLLEYDWPGNIRELENTVERAVVTCEGNRLTRDNVVGFKPVAKPTYVQQDTIHPWFLDNGTFYSGIVAKFQAGQMSLDEFNCTVLHYATKQIKNKSKVAELFEISRPRLDRKLKDYHDNYAPKIVGTTRGNSRIA